MLKQQRDQNNITKSADRRKESQTPQRINMLLREVEVMQSQIIN